MEEHHQWLCGGVADVPEGAHDGWNTSGDERPHERSETLGAEGAASGSAARAEHDESRACELRKLLHQLLRRQLARLPSMRRKQKP